MSEIEPITYTTGPVIVRDRLLDAVTALFGPRPAQQVYDAIVAPVGDFRAINSIHKQWAEREDDLLHIVGRDAFLRPFNWRYAPPEARAVASVGYALWLVQKLIEYCRWGQGPRGAAQVWMFADLLAQVPTTNMSQSMVRSYGWFGRQSLVQSTGEIGKEARFVTAAITTKRAKRLTRESDDELLSPWVSGAAGNPDAGNRTLGRVERYFSGEGKHLRDSVWLLEDGVPRHVLVNLKGFDDEASISEGRPEAVFDVRVEWPLSVTVRPDWMMDQPGFVRLISNNSPIEYVGNRGVSSAPYLHTNTQTALDIVTSGRRRGAVELHLEADIRQPVAFERSAGNDITVYDRIRAFRATGLEQWCWDEMIMQVGR